MTSTAVSATVLIVDDDVGLARLIDRRLRREGITTGLAHSGQDAIEWLTNNKADLLILDLKLTDIEGKELINHLEAINRSIPFVIITGQGDERAAVEMMKRGARDYLVKDVQFLDFVPTVIQRALEQVDKEKRLASAEKRARLTEAVVEQTYSGVLITSRDLPDPTIHYLNPAFATLIGVTISHLLGRPLSALEALIGPWPLLRRILNERKIFVGETQLRRVDGGELMVDCTITGVQGEPHQFTHWAVIVHDITERKLMERQIIEIGERERNRIGRDLHDGLGQQLSALELFTVGLADDLEKQAPKLLKPVRRISEQLREAIRQTRGLAQGLSPISLQSGGLTTALRKLCDMTSMMAGIECKTSGDPGLNIEDSAVATHLYRIAQEAVQNALKHGKATVISIALTRSDRSLELKVQDNGRGFATVSTPDTGMGLRVMRYRADLIGGVLSIDSEPDKGTRVICTFCEKQ